jgi:acyl-CoA synthetase (AMP-forming)/AMP-acid ligase II
MIDSTFTSIGDLLRRHAEEHPERTAFTFLHDGLNPSHVLTYAQLDRRSRAIAAFLQSRLAPGERVMLCFPEIRY